MHIAFWLLSAIAVLVLIGFLYQCIGSYRDRARFAGTGRWVTIGPGCSLYLLERGSGGPTVIFEAGIGATNLNWRHIQETVSRFTGTASDDLGGLGFSSRCLTARTPVNIAQELHNAAERAEIKPPYILVGHSFGGLVMRRYALLYPEDVSGVVVGPDALRRVASSSHPSKQSQLDLGRRLIRYAHPIAVCGLTRLAVASLFWRSKRLLGNLDGATVAGGKHVIDRITNEVGKMPREVSPVVAARTASSTELLQSRAQPHQIDPRHGKGNAPGRAHPRNSRHHPDSGHLHSLVAGTSQPHRRQHSAGDRPGQRTLDSSR